MCITSFDKYWLRFDPCKYFDKFWEDKEIVNCLREMKWQITVQWKMWYNINIMKLSYEILKINQKRHVSLCLGVLGKALLKSSHDQICRISRNFLNWQRALYLVRHCQVCSPERVILEKWKRSSSWKTFYNIIRKLYCQPFPTLNN